jgi:hypothetical protein
MRVRPKYIKRSVDCRISYALISIVTELHKRIYVRCGGACTRIYYLSLSLRRRRQERTTTCTQSLPYYTVYMYVHYASFKLTCSHACIRPRESHQYKYNTSCPPSPSQTIHSPPPACFHLQVRILLDVDRPTMANKLATSLLAAAVLLMALAAPSLAGDPDMLQDICVADYKSLKGRK